MKDKLLQVLIPVSLLMIALAVIEPLLLHPMNPGGWFAYVYSAGAVILLLCRLFTTNDAKDLRLRRLIRLESWSAIFFCVAAFFIFYGTTLRDWLAFTLAGAAIQVFTSIMIPARMRKLSARK